MRRLLIPFLALLLASPSPPRWAVASGSLGPFFEQAREEEDAWEVFAEAKQAVAEVDSHQLAALAWILRHGEPVERDLATLILAYAGEPAAAKVLVRRYKRTKELSLKIMATVALGAADSAASRKLLENALIGETIGDEWQPLETAALSLAVRRETESVPALQRLAAIEPDSFASQAARIALRWIEGGENGVAFEPATPELAVLAAVLRAGLPTASGAPVDLFEPEQRRLWRFSSGAWYSEPAAESPEGVTRITFEIYRSEDQGRAIVTPWLHPERSCSTSWDYILRRSESEGWRVVGLVRTGIS